MANILAFVIWPENNKFDVITESTDYSAGKTFYHFKIYLLKNMTIDNL